MWVAGQGCGGNWRGDGVRSQQLRGGWVNRPIEPHIFDVFDAETAFQRVVDQRISGVQEPKIGGIQRHARK